jgi:hypothetical protein
MYTLALWRLHASSVTALYYRRKGAYLTRYIFTKAEVCSICSFVTIQNVICIHIPAARSRHTHRLCYGNRQDSYRIPDALKNSINNFVAYYRQFEYGNSESANTAGNKLTILVGKNTLHKAIMIAPFLSL